MLAVIKRHFLLIVTAALYVACASFAVKYLAAAEAWSGPAQTTSLSFALFLMCATGFVMLVLLGGALINLSRLHEEREAVWKTAESRLKAIEASPDGIAILGPEGHYTYMNETHAALYGYNDKTEMTGRHWRDLYTPKRALMFQTEVFPLLEKTGAWSGQSEGLRKDGTSFVQEVSLRRLEDGGLICMVRDLTEKIGFEKLMRVIKLAVEAATDGIAITDEDNRILFMNRSFLTMHGYDPYEREKYINTDWRLLYNEKGQEIINAVVLPTTILKGTWSGSLTVMRKDGALFYGDASLTKLADGLILGVMRDISDRRQADMEREAFKEQLFRSQKIEAIGRLTNRVVVDMESILRLVGDSAEELARDTVADARRKACAAAIAAEADKARELIEQLLAFSQQKPDRSSLADLCECVTDAMRYVSGNMPDRVALMMDLKTENAWTYANASQIVQVVKNLCTNSKEALDKDSGKIVVTVKEMDRTLFGLRRWMVAGEKPEPHRTEDVVRRTVQGKEYLISGKLLKGKNYIQVTVSDTAQGIAGDILPHVFDPFFTTKAPGKGTGLGLTTVQGTVVNNGGAVVIETAAGQGTSVHLFFPKSGQRQEAGAMLTS